MNAQDANRLREAEQAASRRRATEDLENIDRLKTYPPMREYFFRRIEEKIAARERIALDPRTGPKETTLQKRIIQALRHDVLNLLDEDEAACRKIRE